MNSLSCEKTCVPIPAPKTFNAANGRFEINPSVYSGVGFAPSAEVLSGYLLKFFGVKVLRTADKDSAGIVFEPDETLMGESYRVTSHSGVITVFASTIAGASHGGSVVLQTAAADENCAERLLIGEFELSDSPDTDFRGLMVDLARGSYPMSDIFAYADLCYFYRLSALHLHFADDGPYKLPSGHFPLFGGERFYSKRDIAELNSYLRDRGITLVPEIEMPSHASPLTIRYPEVFGSRHRGMICPGKEGVFDALDTLIGEVCEMFPDAPYLHIGCDEAPHRDWESCPECSAFMKANGIPSTGALYAYTVGRCARTVLSHGKTPIVWEGFPKEGNVYIPRETVVMVFQSTYQNASELTDAGFRVINTSWQPLYVVPSRPKYWNPDDIYRWKYNRWLLEDAVDDSGAIDVKGENKRLVLGAELCLWEGTTYAPDAVVVEANLAALSERSWNENYPAASEAYSDFERRYKTVSKNFKPF